MTKALHLAAAANFFGVMASYVQGGWNQRQATGRLRSFPSHICYHNERSPRGARFSAATAAELSQRRGVRTGCFFIFLVRIVGFRHSCAHTSCSQFTAKGVSRAVAINTAPQERLD